MDLLMKRDFSTKDTQNDDSKENKAKPNDAIDFFKMSAKLMSFQL
jgi:hypothetical protein